MKHQLCLWVSTLSNAAAVYYGVIPVVRSTVYHEYSAYAERFLQGIWNTEKKSFGQIKSWRPPLAVHHWCLNVPVYNRLFFSEEQWKHTGCIIMPLLWLTYRNLEGTMERWHLKVEMLVISPAELWLCLFHDWTTTQRLCASVRPFIC